MHYSYEEALSRGWISPDDVPNKTGVKKTRKTEHEGQEQSHLIKKFRELYPQYADLLIHIPNGGSRKNAYEGWRLKEQGVRAGVSDLFLPVVSHGYAGLWLEFKAAPPNNSPVSQAQRDWLNLVKAQGYAVTVCLGAPAALAAICAYLTGKHVPELST